MIDQNARPKFTSDKYEFTNQWFIGSVYGLKKGPVVDVPTIWTSIFSQRKIKNVLEIGSYEGQSTCFLIEFLGGETGSQISCIDTWEGSFEHSEKDFSEIERRFDQNTEIALNDAPNEVIFRKIKNTSTSALAKLILEKSTFDLIYIDGSHHSMDVLSDLVMASHLLSENGLIIGDDYLWEPDFNHAGNPNITPKPAIDAFCNIFYEKFRVMTNVPTYQCFIEKIK